MSQPSSISKHLIRVIIGMSILLLVVVAGSVAGIIIVGKRLQTIVTQAPAYTAQQLFDSAVQQIDKGSYPAAENYLEQALSKQDDATYRSQLAVVKYRLKKYSESVDQYQKLIDQKKDIAFAYNGMGNAYRDWADMEAAHKTIYQEKAITAYKTAIQTDPHYVAAYSNLAILLNNQGKTAEAVQVLQAGIPQTQQPELQELYKRLTDK